MTPECCPACGRSLGWADVGSRRDRVVWSTDAEGVERALCPGQFCQAVLLGPPKAPRPTKKGRQVGSESQLLSGWGRKAK
jgi:hypothetical protein